MKSRVVNFMIIGAFVAAIGAVLMFIFIDIVGIEENAASIFQLIITLQINFLLNYFVTWRDIKGPIVPQWVKYHTYRIGVTVLNQILFSILVIILPYMISYVLGIVFAAVLNYILSQKYVFTPSRATANA